MKKRTLLCMGLVLLLGLTACSEHDEDYVAPKEKSDSSNIKLEVDLDAAYSQDTCMAYEGKSWNFHDERKLLETFFSTSGKGSYTREEQLKDRLYFENRKDPGEFFSYYGSEANKYDSSGIAYGTRESDQVNEMLANKEIEAEIDSYGAYDGAPDEGWKKIDITDEKKQVEARASGISMQYYEPEFAVELNKKKKTIKQIFWHQVIDGISVCRIPLDKVGGGLAGKIIYNDRLLKGERPEQKYGNLVTTFLNGKLVNWYNTDALMDMKPYQELEIIPVRDAYETAARQVAADLKGKTEDIRLVKAALEYKVNGKDGKVYAYPVWNFNFYADMPQGTAEHYVYLVDAVTGGFFAGIDKLFG